MAEAAIPLLNLAILGSFMIGGVAQLRKLSSEASESSDSNE